jgi:hypothetical protein
MENFDLISAIQGEEGFFALCSMRPGGGMQQVLLDSREAVDAKIEAWGDTRDIYFGVAKYVSGEGRTKDNVLNLKTFWLDLDCGPTKVASAPGERPKGYATKREAALALAAFCEKVGLPEPTIVDSGGGLHCYWPLEEPITRSQWEPVAAALKARCHAENLYVDPAVFEVSRILRVPGTSNLKQGTPRPVTVKVVGEPVTLDDFCARFDMKAVAAAAPPHKERQSKLGSAMEAGAKSYDPITFTKIKNQCQQLQQCVDDAATLEEPLWRAALSVATRCLDRDTAMASVSDTHPDYDPAKTEAKAVLTLGPYSCAQFDNLRPGGCKGCPFKGKLVSPVSLGTTIPADDGTVYEEGILELVSKLPPGYELANNSIMLVGGAEAGDLLVYDLPLFVVRRFTDPDGIDTVQLRLFTDMDGARDIMLPTASSVDLSALKEALASRSMVGGAKMYSILASYIVACITNLKQKYKADPLRHQFGWSDDNDMFTVGNMEIRRGGGTTFSPDHEATRELASKMVARGTFEKWQEIFNIYSEPGMELHAFAAYTAFGAPLMKFTGLSGGLISLYSPKSGTGKSAALAMCNSVWGHPKELCGKAQDTLNARVTRMGHLNNLPATFDELSNMRGDVLSDFAYSMSQGSGKDRMKSNSNELRTNNATWQTITLCSSNMSFYQKLSSVKDAPEGEMMRIMEFYVPRAAVDFTEERTEIFAHTLYENYGFAGPMYIRYLIDRLPKYIADLKQLMTKFNRDLRVLPRERFWAAKVCCNIMGARIARDANIIQFNETRMYSWIGAEFLEMRAAVGEPVEVYAELLGRFYNENVSRLLEIDAYDGRSKFKPAPTKTPAGNTQLTMRFEANAQRLYIDKTAFEKFCTDRTIGHVLAVRWLKEQKLIIDTSLKHMAAGWLSGGGVVNVHVIDTSHKAFSLPAPIVQDVESDE